MTMMFVYGTLRKGQYNNGLLRNARYVRDAIVSGYKMVDLGSYPAIYQTGEDDDIVYGEIYDVDDSALETIDSMELGAGYKLSTISSYNIRLYEYDRDKAIRHRPVSSGDWVKHKEKPKDCENAIYLSDYEFGTAFTLG